MIEMFKPNALISIYGSASLSQDDVNIVTLLYGPLIKSDAYKLYMTLESLLERSSLKSEAYQHQELLDLLNFDGERFFKARMRLEAIGLLATYESGNEYLFLLKSPLTAKQFLTDGVLGMYLYSELGNNQFRRLQHLFSVTKVDKTNFTEITANFDDVFESIEEVEVKTDEVLLDHRFNPGITINNFNFDFHLFQEGIAKTFLNGKRITPKFENFIKNLAYAYEFNEEQMQEIYTKSLNNNGFFDYQLCSRRARETYKENHELKLPKLGTKEEVTMGKNEKLFTKFSAKGLLEFFSNSKVATAFDLEKVQTLYEEYSEVVPRSVLNVCVVYCIKKCDGEVPAYTYFDKVIKEWISKGYNTFDVCYLELQKDKQTTKKSKKKTAEPDWLKEYKEKFEDEVEDL